MPTDKLVKVEVKTLNSKIIGHVEERNLFDFNNGMDSSLRVRMIQGHSKGTDYHETQVAQVQRI